VKIPRGSEAQTAPTGEKAALGISGAGDKALPEASRIRLAARTHQSFGLKCLYPSSSGEADIARDTIKVSCFRGGASPHMV
jgi:hypothetical protein